MTQQGENTEQENINNQSSAVNGNLRFKCRKMPNNKYYPQLQQKIIAKPSK